jgi:putative oxidoreductase
MKKYVNKLSYFLDSKCRRWFDALSLLALRFGFGGLLVYKYGWEKYGNFMVHAKGYPDPFGWGGPITLCFIVFVEVACAIMLVLGLFTRLSAFFTFIVMLLAYRLHPEGDLILRAELPVLYAISFFVLMLKGAGAVSLDAAFTDRKMLADLLGRRSGIDRRDNWQK